MKQIAYWHVEGSIEAPQVAIFAVTSLEVLLNIELFFFQLLKDMLIDGDPIPEDRKHCMAFVCT